MLLLTGCGGTPTEGGGAGSSNLPQQADKNDMNPQPREALRQGGSMTWAITGTLPNFNYNQLDGTQADGALIILAVMPQNFLFDASGSPRFNPDYLMAEPKIEVGPPQVVRYMLNPKATWYDGTPITAADYIAQWKALNGTNTKFHIAGSNGYSEMASVTQGADKFEAVVTFKKAYADWKSLFNPLYPASTNSDPEIFNNGWKDKFLTSAGPFKFQSYDATAKIYTIVPNEKWWGNKPKLDSIVFRAIDADAQPTAIANGEIDMMDVGPVADYYNKVKVVPGIDIRVAGGPNFRHITINGQSPVLKDLKVRQALAMAIDRDAIARAQLGPLPVMPVSLGNHIFMQNQKGYQDNSAVVAYNPDKARQLLDEAGWKVQGMNRVKDGKTLSINLIIPTGIAVSRSESELIQNMLAQVNVKVDINAIPIDDLFDKYVTPGRFDFTVFSWFGTPFPISATQSIYMMPKGDAVRQNYARTGSAEIDRLYLENLEELDPEKAIERANQIDKLLWEEVHSLTSYQRPDIWAVKAGLSNIGAYGFASISYEDIGWLAE
jgi:peptide/nickel transport system substrate-binding protein